SRRPGPGLLRDGGGRGRGGRRPGHHRGDLPRATPVVGRRLELDALVGGVMASNVITKERATRGPALEADLAKRLLHDMMLIRRFEEKAAEAYTLGKIGGFLHLSIGEEAVAAGASSVLRPDDYAISTYREHGHCLAKGADPRRAMAELFGRRDGLSKGKGGSMPL